MAIDQTCPRKGRKRLARDAQAQLAAAARTERNIDRDEVAKHQAFFDKVSRLKAFATPVEHIVSIEELTEGL